MYLRENEKEKLKTGEVIIGRAKKMREEMGLRGEER